MPGRFAEDDEQKQHVGEVQQQIGEMVTAGPRFVRGAVEHQREPGKRSPIGEIEPAKGPFDSGERQAGRTCGLALHIVRIVKCDELETPNLPVDCDCHCGQREEDYAGRRDSGPGRQPPARPD